jgi:hypothetical protein
LASVAALLLNIAQSSVVLAQAAPFHTIPARHRALASVGEGVTHVPSFPAD